MRRYSEPITQIPNNVVVEARAEDGTFPAPPVKGIGLATPGEIIEILALAVADAPEFPMMDEFPAKVVYGGVAPPVTDVTVAVAADDEDAIGTQDTETIFCGGISIAAVT